MEYAMSNRIRPFFCLCLLFAIIQRGQCSDKTPLLIGDCEKVYTAANDNKEIRGLAFDESSAEAARLFTLDASGHIYVYRLRQDAKKQIDKLELMDKISLPKDTDRSSLAGSRGLAFVKEGKQEIFYFLNYEGTGRYSKSQLWRCNFKTKDFTCIDLSDYRYKIGYRETFDLVYDDGKILICYDGAGYHDSNMRVRRGILQLKWPSQAEKPEFVKHMPDSGEFPSYGIARMTLGGAEYVWATAGKDYIYSAEASTGRGLFYFDRPSAEDSNERCFGLTFGQNTLWIPQSQPGTDRICRVNVTKNAGTPYEGPKILRHLMMTIRTEPKKENVADPGKVYHYYSRPYPYEQFQNQGFWPDTEKVVDTSRASNASISMFTYDPAADSSSRQYMRLVEYPNAPARTYSSQYEIDLWTNWYCTYVYPHLVNKNTDGLAGTEYLADDPELFNLNDTKTYDSFFERVKQHIKDKYGVDADVDNPYWAARNAVEYIQDVYYYPGLEQNMPATVDYSKKHYDANPGNMKLALSERNYDKTQIIACSGTSVALSGAMRYAGHPARWLGTATERDPSFWDKNENGLLDSDETAPCFNGHRYTQVWLGDLYGWICFDATPTRPAFGDYDPAPPLKSQWRYMERAARGHLLDKRVVFNVGSKLFRPLYRDFVYDERLAVNNNCGGDQRYNLNGRFDKPEEWNTSSHRIYVKNLCLIKNVALSGPKDKTQVTWKLEGQWDKDPDATVSVYLQRVYEKSRKAQDITKLAKGLPYNALRATVDLSRHRGKRYRIIIRKDGDSETGGSSKMFDLD